jgi:hypothetical protein
MNRRDVSHQLHATVAPSPPNENPRPLLVFLFAAPAIVFEPRYLTQLTHSGTAANPAYAVA